MNWTQTPATESQAGSGGPPGPGPPFISASSSGTVSSPLTSELIIGKSLSLSPKAGEPSREVFTLTLGSETIELLPLKNWIQLDHFKWTVRGKLPAEPAGLEITPDHVRLVGETVALNDPEGCFKLERLFNEWLRFERETLELARKKLQAHARVEPIESRLESAPQGLRFRVEVDKRGKVHIHSEQGRNTLASIGLTITGLKSLCQQGLMRKPHSMETGALHDWIELDGELCSFEKGNNDAARLEHLLNERYVPAVSGGAKEVAVFVNAASSSGFDIQFPVKLAGIPDNHRYHLNDFSLELLMDPERCGLLHKDVIVKLIPPNLVFKHRTPDGGEEYFAWSSETTVSITDEDGTQTSIPLSQPLNLLRLSPAELTAVFNHPSINRHAIATAQCEPAPSESPMSAPATTPTTVARPQHNPERPPQETHTLPAESQATRAEASRTTPVPQISAAAPTAFPMVREQAALGAGVERLPRTIQLEQIRANLWLKEILAQPVLPHDWFACLVYSKAAERFGNSSEGKFGPAGCWFIALGIVDDIEDPEFKGLFLTEKGSIGFLNEGQMARFYNGVAFVGARQAALEGIEVHLVAMGLDAQERVVFIVSNDYREKFGVPETTLAEVLDRLSQYGALVMSVAEVLATWISLEVVWTAPVTQLEPNEPRALEHTRPAPVP